MAGSELEKLVQLALSAGASRARVIAAADILVEDKLAKLCVQPRCSNYGLSPSCPPHVGGTPAFRRLQKKLKHALVVRMDVPSAVLFSDELVEVERFLHELVANVEQEAVRLGYDRARAFAGGSCKQIFCHDQVECRRLLENGECRHPQSARPSLLGFGVDVLHLMKTCGWTVGLNDRLATPGGDSMSWIAGLVML
jgi:predicted metal-binding protein